MIKKKLTEYTDRELLEKTAVFMKTTAENTSFIKNYFIVMTVLSIVVGLIIAFNLS